MRKNFIKKTLKNGVKLYLYIDNTMKKTLVDYSINYGSSGEYFDFYLNDTHHHVLPGCAHFLEHLLGEHSKYGNIYQRFAKRKYIKNGLTSMKTTHYFFIGVDEILESIKELITAIDNPIFTNEDIINTSKAICEETKPNNKQKKAYAVAYRNIFSNIEFISETLNPIGDENTTKMINYDMLMSCYDAFYYDENKTLLIAGNIDELEITNYIESIYESLPKHENKMKPYINDYGKVRRKEQIEYMDTDENYVNILFRNTINNNFNLKEIFYFSDFLLYSKLRTDSNFIEKLKKEGIITRVEDYNFLKIKNELCYKVSVSTNHYRKFIKLLKEELLKNNFSKNEFNLYIKCIIANQVKRIDYKYDFLKNFCYYLEYTDDFDDIDFLKQLTFERFKKFYKTLSFNNHTTAIIQQLSELKTHTSE